MLVISRSILESVLVYAPSGDIIEFTILGVTNGQVKLGLTAPRDWPILRAELADREEKWPSRGRGLIAIVGKENYGDYIRKRKQPPAGGGGGGDILLRRAAGNNRNVRQEFWGKRSAHAQVQAAADRLNAGSEGQSKSLRGGSGGGGRMARWDGAESPSEERKRLRGGGGLGGGLVGRPSFGGGAKRQEFISEAGEFGNQGGKERKC